MFWPDKPQRSVKKLNAYLGFFLFFWWKLDEKESNTICLFGINLLKVHGLLSLTQNLPQLLKLSNEMF